LTEKVDEKIDSLSIGQDEIIKKNNPTIFYKPKNSHSTKINGSIKDKTTNQAIAFAAISIHNIGVVCDENGYFELSIPSDWQNDSVQISCLGYENQDIAVKNLLGKKNEILLNTNVLALKMVFVRSETLTAEKILRKCIERFPKNYSKTRFNLEYYAYANGQADSTICYDIEYVNELALEDGYLSDKDWFERKCELRGVRINKKMDVDTLKFLFNHMNIDPYMNKDGVGKQAIFKRANLKKFKLGLDLIEQAGQDTVYVIRFESLRKSRIITGTPWTKKFGGSLFINAKDFAVLRADFIWERDTIPFNQAIRNGYLDKVTPFDRVEEHNIKSTFLYQKKHNDFYVLSYANTNWYFKGLTNQYSKLCTTNEKVEFYLQKLFTQNPRTITKNNLHLQELKYDETFWQNYKINLFPIIDFEEKKK
jgi:hypothetical protein